MGAGREPKERRDACKVRGERERERESAADA